MTKADQAFETVVREQFERTRKAMIAEGYRPCVACSMLTLGPSAYCETCRVAEQTAIGEALRRRP